MKKYKIHIIWAIAVVVIFIGGYFWGRHTTAAARGGFAANSFSSSTRARFGGGAAGATGAAGGFTIGQVTAIGSSSLTLQLANGNSEVVFYSTSTSVTEPKTVPVNELQSGSNVMISGTTNSDGSVTAQSIQVRPAGMGSGFGGGSSTTGQ